MSELIGQTDSLHEALGEAGKKIIREEVEKVLIMIEERHPELDDKTFDGIRDKIRDAMLENIGFANRGNAFEMIVTSGLEENGVLQKEEIPKELNIPESVREKLNPLLTEANRKHVDVIAYMILNATSDNDLRKKIGAAHFSIDATQLLMPIFSALMEIDPSAKEKLLNAVSRLEAYKVMLGLSFGPDKYFFDRENSQPYAVLALRYANVIPDMACKELHTTHVMTMLKILKEYLQS